MADDRADDERPPEEIGAPRLERHVPGTDGPQPPVAPRIARAVIVGLLFSVVPVLLTHLVLTSGEGPFDPQALGAAIPVIAVAIWLSRPRDRWYAVGDRGLAIGERFFGQVRWDALLFEETDRVEVSAQRAETRAGAYRFTGYRFVFDGGGKKRIVVEGQVEEPEPHGEEIRLPEDEDLPSPHELPALRAAVQAWEAATGKTAELEGVRGLASRAPPGSS
jgi:hypothetical protein